MSSISRDHHSVLASNVTPGLFDGAGFGVAAQTSNWRELFPEFIGESDELGKVLEFVAKVAPTESVVLIRGESGTGKELIARAIHRLSKRSARPIVTVNCSAIPENLLESELFGHVRGAFTGADKNRVGVFEEAAGGTVFLDEIGDMDFKLQAKLLRVLQEKCYTPVGTSKVKKADVRIVAATNVDLEKAMREDRFREDLFYRLNVLPVQSPSLRERRTDIPVFLRKFVEQSNRVHGVQNPCFFTDASLARLQNYDWPGNIRELQNLVERLVITSGGGALTPELLPKECFRMSENTLVHAPVPAPIHQQQFARAESYISPEPIRPGRKAVQTPTNFGGLPDAGVNLPELIEQLENSYILQALERTNNNKNQAAKLLGLNRTTLVERIKKRKITRLNSPSREL